MYSKILAMFEKPVVDDSVKFLCFAFGLTWDGTYFRHCNEVVSPEWLEWALDLPTKSCQVLAQMMSATSESAKK